MKRPRRVYLKHESIANYWHGRGMLRDGMWPACMGCGEGFDRWQDLERCHLVDRSRDGLDFEPNVVLLCSECHRVMPSFAAEEGEAALQWVRSRPGWVRSMVMRLAWLVVADPIALQRTSQVHLSEELLAELRAWAVQTMSNDASEVAA